MSRRAAVRSYFTGHPQSTIANASGELGIPAATLNRDLAALKKSGFERGAALREAVR